MAQRIDGIAKLLNCPTKGDDIRRAIKQARKDPGLQVAAEDEGEKPDEPVAPADADDLCE